MGLEEWLDDYWGNNTSAFLLILLQNFPRIFHNKLKFLCPKFGLVDSHKLQAFSGFRTQNFINQQWDIKTSLQRLCSFCSKSSYYTTASSLIFSLDIMPETLSECSQLHMIFIPWFLSRLLTLSSALIASCILSFTLQRPWLMNLENK